MPFSPIIALFAVGLTLLAGGSPLGAVFLVLGAIMLSLKLGMPVVTHEPSRRNARSSRHGSPRA